MEILKDIPESKYHDNMGESVPLFSYSTAKTIINESPFHAWMDHPKLGNMPKAQSSAMDIGNIIHGMLLGSGPEIVVIDADSYRTNAAKEERDKAYLEGKIPILAKDHDELEKAIVLITKNIKAVAPYFFDEPHECEVSFLWDMDNGVKTKSRIDWIGTAIPKIIDLKTTNDANPDKLARKILDMGYDMQEAAYMMCAGKHFPDLAGRFSFEFIFVETEAPYMVSVIDTDATMKWLGESKLFRAADIWKSCLESGIWPGYGRKTVSAPSWAISKEEAEEV